MNILLQMRLNNSTLEIYWLIVYFYCSYEDYYKTNQDENSQVTSVIVIHIGVFIEFYETILRHHWINWRHIYGLKVSLGDEDETNLLKSLEPWILLDRQLSTFGSMKIPIAFIIYMRLRMIYIKHIIFRLKNILSLSKFWKR